MQLKLIQMHHKSRGRPPTRVRSREGPVDSKFMIYDSGLEIPGTRNRIGNWKCRRRSSRVEYWFYELQYANTVAVRRLPGVAPGRNAMGLNLCDLNTVLARKSRIRKNETGIPLARDWVNFTCSGKTSEKPDGYNHIAVLIEMNHST